MAKLRATALWTRGDQAKEDRIGEEEREGQMDNIRGDPNKLCQRVSSRTAHPVLGWVTYNRSKTTFSLESTSTQLPCTLASLSIHHSINLSASTSPPGASLLLTMILLLLGHTFSHHSALIALGWGDEEAEYGGIGPPAVGPLMNALSGIRFGRRDIVHGSGVCDQV